MEKAKQRAQRFGIVSGLALEGSLCEAAHLSDSNGNIETVDSITVTGQCLSYLQLVARRHHMCIGKPQSCTLR